MKNVSVSLTSGGTVVGTLTINAERINERIDFAQDVLDAECLKRTRPKIPMQSGVLLSRTSVVEPGLLRTEGPSARYLYYGKLMLAPNGSAWAHYGEKKILTETPLHYNQEPERGAYWFERMKVENLEELRRITQRALKGDRP